MVVRTPAELRADMPVGVPKGISAQDIQNLIDTLEDMTAQNVVAKTADYTATALENRRFFTMDSASATTFTVPAAAPAGWECALMQIGAGQTAIAVGGTGALRHPDGHTKVLKQYGMVYLKVYANAGSAPQVGFTGDTAP